jgi:hypothetical protein
VCSRSPGREVVDLLLRSPGEQAGFVMRGPVAAR